MLLTAHTRLFLVSARYFRAWNARAKIRHALHRSLHCPYKFGGAREHIGSCCSCALQVYDDARQKKQKMNGIYGYIFCVLFY